jgi:NAD(P)-dependent dehydrogenase (short-subunit alcohol dehydrogenase family)
MAGASGRAHAVEADVSCPTDVERLFDEACRWGSVTAVTNNAAITGNLIGSLVDVPVETGR